MLNDIGWNGMIVMYSVRLIVFCSGSMLVGVVCMCFCSSELMVSVMSVVSVYVMLFVDRLFVLLFMLWFMMSVRLVSDSVSFVMCIGC